MQSPNRQRFVVGLGIEVVESEEGRFSLLLTRSCLEWLWGNWTTFWPNALDFTEGEPVPGKIY